MWRCERLLDDGYNHFDGIIYDFLEEPPEESSIMAIIEGVGDEVTFTLLVLLVLLVLIIAWVSTQVNDDPWFRIIILDRQRIQEFIAWLRARHPGAVRLQEIHIRRQVHSGSATTTQVQAGSSPEATTLLTSESVPEDNTGEQDINSGIPPYTAPGTTFKAQSNITSASPPADSPLSPSADAATTQEENSTVCSTTQPEVRLESDTRAGCEESHPRAAQVSRDQPSATVDNSSAVPGASDAARDIDSETVTSTNTSQSQTALPGNGADNVSESDTSPAVEVAVDGATENENLGECLPGHIRVKIKYLDERQRLVMAKPEDTIGDFKRKHFSAELAQHMMIRFIFRGQELRQESVSLQSYRVEDNSVIHCLLNRGVTANQPAAQQPRGLDLDIGTLMFPLFGLILGLIWYCRFSYKQYFNAVSTLALMGITFLYLVAATAAYRSGSTQQHQHQD